MAFSDEDFELARKTDNEFSDRLRLLVRLEEEERERRERIWMTYSPLWNGSLSPCGYLHRTGTDFYNFAWHADRHWQNDRSAPFGPGPAYYVFLEETLSPEMAGPVDGPDGQSVDVSRHKVLRASPIRFRSSGILIQDFHHIEGSFEELDPENISDDQQGQRKKDIVEHLGDISLPVLDLYISPNHPDLKAIRMMLTPGSWHVLGVSSDALLEEECLVLIGAPELGETPYAYSFLAYLGPVPAHIEVRLRDIFSLAHIADASFNTERGTADRGGTPPPTGPVFDEAHAAELAKPEDLAVEDDPPAVRYYRPPEMEA